VAAAVFAAATVAALTGLVQVAAQDATGATAPPQGSAAPSAAPSNVQHVPHVPHVLAGVKITLLGDSLAAGEGGGNYFTGTNEPHQRCHRSAAGWFAETAADVTNAACSRAIVRNLDSPQQHPEYNARAESPQLDAVGGDPADIALVMLGGNDIRFAEVFNQCVLSDADCTSDPAFTAAALRSAQTVSGELAGAYRRVASQTAVRTVLVPAYPQLFGEDSRDCGRISPAEATFARELTAALNVSARGGAEAAAATHPGIHFVPVTEDALAGHGACDQQPYVHTVLPAALVEAAQQHSAAQELLHPTAAGYGKLTEALTSWLAGNPSIPVVAP
jgi:lysophospholipase L1-like esterase